ncbi:MAG: AGE family epimerase/isomerase [Spirosomaceae bacterium]|jgi:mannobiose 2-epimerase|nr:AGE family epimerase/isomerase [Spirosomataceae bacterium]
MMNLDVFKTEIGDELKRIIDFWKSNSVDLKNGGFVGRLDSYGEIHPQSEKGLVLYARILWSFSAHYNFSKDKESLNLAERAYQYLNIFFRDNQNGGLFWSVEFDGKPKSTRKQIYGLAFTIYALSEFYKATQNNSALNWAIELFNLIEEYSFDDEFGGYFEAFSLNWDLIEDLRLSEKDRNDPKTMNTHLHVIEAYANLYEVWKDRQLKSRIIYLLELFDSKIINKKNFHLGLFFSKNWISQSDCISFGHDIEAAWLLLDCAKKIDDKDLIKKFSDLAIKIADAASEGFNLDGSLKHEYSPSTNQIDSHREWWVSAEAMVGYLNAYQITQQEKYLLRVSDLWSFIRKHLFDYTNGEWFWGVYEDYSKMLNEDKIGFWKCPYHNTRACILIIEMLK